MPSLAPRVDGSAVTVTDLYEAYCAKWFDHNVTRLALTRDFKEALVEHLACRLWNEPEQSVHHTRLTDAATAFFEDRPLNPLEKEQVDYEVRTALFLHRDDDGNYRFIHRSFLEFFVARTLRAGLTNADRTCLDLRALTREVAFFLEQWPEAEMIPELTRQVLASAYTQRISENALRLLYFHVRTRVAGPLVGPDAEEQDSDDVLAGIAERFGELRPDAVDLAGADLGGATLRGADLSRARLAKARLDRCDLRGAVAGEADLDGASLVFADLRRARLADARLAGAVLDHADARGADLRGAVLDRADLTFARFAGADLTGASMVDAGTMGTAFGPGATEPRCVPQVGHSWWVRSVAWRPDGKVVASGGVDGTVLLWDPADGRLLAVLEGHTQRVGSVAWDGAGKRLASGSSDQTVKIWDPESGRVLATLAVASAARGLACGGVAADGAGRLAVATLAGIVEIWDVSAEPRRLARLYEAHPVTGLVVTEDGWVDGPPEALRNVRFADGQALYDLDDLPERHAPERVRAALARPAS
jgi:uncharacterized protein YjbI with pentapeptide repeats